ncbi:MAG: hypothetical protein JRF33_22930 [Deltaproteobacteria bacterium]|nr:hypothetical protein [Deltaproteobacteria bacterium]
MTNKTSSCGLCRRASQALFNRLKRDCILVYVDHTNVARLSGVVARAMRSTEAGRFIPKAVIATLNGEVLATIPFARGPKHVSLIRAALAKVAKRVGPKNQSRDGGQLSLALRWKGNLSPMPLLVATRFFQRSGFKAESQTGGPGLCRYKVQLDYSCERLSSMLRQYLQSRYGVSGGVCKGGSLTFRLTPLPGDASR